MNDTQLCQCGCGRAAIRGRHFAYGHAKKRRPGVCGCGCGKAVGPGSRFCPGHHMRTSSYRYNMTAKRLRRNKAVREQIHKAFAEHGGLVDIAVKSARWDDEWAVAGQQALRDTAEVLDILGRYGCVEVSYGAARGHEDPLLALDTQIEIMVEAAHVKKLRKQFEKAGFEGLTDEEVKYLYLNHYESVEEFAA